MPLRRRSPPHGANGREDWLAHGENGRERPWAYEELLLGPLEDRERQRELAAVLRELDVERVELARLHEELDAHLTRVTTLDRRLEELTKPPKSGGSDGKASPRTLPHPRPEHVHEPGARDGWSRLLAHCEGFDVQSPGGPVGFVEGVRFVSRIDRPDLLEVRGGRFGRRLVLVPVEQVDEIRLAEGRVTLRSTPAPTTDLLDDLGDRLRRAFHFDHTAP